MKTLPSRVEFGWLTLRLKPAAADDGTCVDDARAASVVDVVGVVRDSSLFDTVEEVIGSETDSAGFTVAEKLMILVIKVDGLDDEMNNVAEVVGSALLVAGLTLIEVGSIRLEKVCAELVSSDTELVKL